MTSWGQFGEADPSGKLAASCCWVLSLCLYVRTTGSRSFGSFLATAASSQRRSDTEPELNTFFVLRRSKKNNTIKVCAVFVSSRPCVSFPGQDQAQHGRWKVHLFCSLLSVWGGQGSFAPRSPSRTQLGIATELCTTDFASVLARRFWEFVLLPSPHGQDLLLSIRLARTSRRRCSNMCQQWGVWVWTLLLTIWLLGSLVTSIWNHCWTLERCLTAKVGWALLTTWLLVLPSFAVCISFHSPCSSGWPCVRDAPIRAMRWPKTWSPFLPILGYVASITFVNGFKLWIDGLIWMVASLHQEHYLSVLL